MSQTGERAPHAPYTHKMCSYIIAAHQLKQRNKLTQAQADTSGKKKKRRRNNWHRAHILGFKAAGKHM